MKSGCAPLINLSLALPPYKTRRLRLHPWIVESLLRVPPMSVGQGDVCPQRVIPASPASHNVSYGHGSRTKPNQNEGIVVQNPPPVAGPWLSSPASHGRFPLQLSNGTRTSFSDMAPPMLDMPGSFSFFFDCGPREEGVFACGSSRLTHHYPLPPPPFTLNTTPPPPPQR